MDFQNFKFSNKLIFLFVATIGLTSCSHYFIRKNCEATNWFDYGFKVAMEGRRLTGDSFVNECYKAEGDVAEAELDRGFKAGLEKYCQPETVFQTGRDGKFFSTEMCDGGSLNSLKLKHTQGVLDYCRRENGFAAGSKGNPYNKICPSDLEKSFLPEFNRGRSKYLTTLKTLNNNQISEHQRQVNRLESELSYKKGVLVGLEAMTPATPSEEQLSKLRSMRSDVTSLESSVSSYQRKIKDLQAKNREIDLELAQLGQ